MGFRRLVVHVGAPKTATTAIQRGLFSNRELLAASGVHLPESGRLEFEPRAVSHHHLAWEIHRPEQYSPQQGGWQALAEELDGVETDTVLLSSEGFLRALLPEFRDSFERRLRALCDDITVVICVREQLALINSFYTQDVKMLLGPPPFPEYVDWVLDEGMPDFDARLAPWYDAAGITLKAVPFGAADSPEPLVGLLEAAGVPLPPSLDLQVPHANPSLGPVGVEAARLLASHLRGGHPDFDPRSTSGRRLHRIAGRSARENGWCDAPYWGWTPSLAEDVAQRLAAGNERFARAVWGTPWPLHHPLDRSRRSVRIEDLTPERAHQVSRFVLNLADRFTRLGSAAV